MFRRKTKTKSSFLVLHSSSRGSDIVKPNNTSLIVNESDTESDPLPKELTSILSEDEDGILGGTVRSSSLMKSLSQKQQSTPLSQFTQSSILKRKKNSPKFKDYADTNKPSYFDEVLKGCGATPLPEDSSFLMSEDQAVFSIKVNKKLRENSENIKKFVDSIKNKIKDQKYLQKMLAHTLTDESCEAARGPVQEPMMRMLLNVECLQSDLVDLLLQSVADVIVGNEKESENIQIVSSILRQMRFLCRVSHVKMASRLLEIIEVATINAKKEIIFMLPEIISEEETEETCNQLIDMLKFDEILTHVIIDALTNLPMSKTLTSMVCSKILQRLDKCPMEFLPSLVQFVLNKCHLEEHSEVIGGLRKNLPFTSQHYEMRQAERKNDKKKSDEDSYVKLTFEHLKFSMMASKELTEAWIKVISNLSFPNEFRCVDLVMLIIFHSCLFLRKAQVLHLMRNKIKTAVLTHQHVQNMFKILPVITEEYSSPILEIASVLLKSVEMKISKFGALLYKECFINFTFYQKHIVISEILLHIGIGSRGTVNTALTALKELCESDKKALSKHASSIMGLLVKVPDLDLTQVRLLMDVIADLICFGSSENGTAALDELEIFIKKQLISSKPEQCKKGVSAAIMFGKHFGKKGNVDDGNHAEVNSLLELAMSSKGASETKTGFFNDEFATMAAESRLNNSFLDIWSKKTFSLVMDNLFVRNIDVECDDFPMSLQYSLKAEGVQEYVFPVVEFIQRSDSPTPLNVPVPVIPSTLRLLWCLERNLTRILPVFYASVIMPEDTVYDGFNNLDEYQQKKIMGCLFLCANYLTECVNALCAHGILDKAALRVKQLISVRQLISKHINLIEEFEPQFCQFYTPTQRVIVKKKMSEKKAKRGRKRKLDEAVNTSVSFAETRPTERTQIPAPAENVLAEQKEHEADLRPYYYYFRELAFLTHELLAADFKSENSSNSFRMSNGGVEPELKTCDVLFLLEDLIFKSEQILKSTETTFNFRSKPGILLIQKVKQEELIAASVRILPELLNKIEKFSKYCEELLVANDWILDSRGLYVPGACQVKLAMAAGLKFIADIVSWQGFQNFDDKLLRDFLSILANRKNSVKTNTSVEFSESVATDAADYLATFSQKVLVLSGGLSIVKSFQACIRCSSRPCKALADLCHGFLCKNWYTVAGAPERGSTYNQHIDFLLKTFFSYVENKLDTVQESARIALNEIGGLTSKDSVLDTFKTINKTNFPLLYRTVCEALVSAATSELSRNSNDNEKQLEIWNKVVGTLLVLVDIAKAHSSRPILASLLKRSQSIIQLFLSKGMPVVETALRVKSLEVLTLLKSLQGVTRFLHSICCHSRVTNDSVVAAHVPTIRSQCERLTFEVKGMMILNGLPTDCITIAILKNRDIKGNDIISQETLDEDSDSDDQLPPEDTPEPEENLYKENVNEITQEFNSESY